MPEKDLLIASFIAKHQLDQDAATAVLLDLTSYDLGVIITAFEPALTNGVDKEALLRRFVQVYFDQKTQAFVNFWDLPEIPTKELLSRLNYKDRGLVMERFSIDNADLVDQTEKHRVLRALIKRRMEHRINAFVGTWQFEGADRPSAVKLLLTLTNGDLQVILAAFNPEVLPRHDSRYSLLVRTVNIYMSRKVDAFISYWSLESVKKEVESVLAQLWHDRALGFVLERINFGSISNPRDKLAKLHRYIHRLVTNRVNRFASAEGLQEEPLWEMALKTLSVKKLLLLVDTYSIGPNETPSQALGKHITDVSQQHARPKTTPVVHVVDNTDESENDYSIDRGGQLPSSVAELRQLLVSGEVVLPEEVLRELHILGETAVVLPRE